MSRHSSFTSRRPLRRSVQFIDRSVCSTSRVALLPTSQKIALLSGRIRAHPADIDRGDESLCVVCLDSAAGTPLATSVTFALLCSCGESFATRSLTTSLMVLASLLLMGSPLLSCCRQKKTRGW